MPMNSRKILTCACSFRNTFAPLARGNHRPCPRLPKQRLPAAPTTHLATLALVNTRGVAFQQPPCESNFDVRFNSSENDSIHAYLRFLGREQATYGTYTAPSYPPPSLSVVDNQGVVDVLGSARRKELELQHAHQEITRILQTGQIVEAVKNPISEYGHESYTVVLQDRRSQRKVRALFKPTEEGHGQGWHRVPIEWVAYKLNLMLGLDLVPPVVYRKEVDVDFQHFREGIFMYYVDNACVLKDTPSQYWGVDKEVLLTDTRIMDVLLQNSDRHHGNFLFGEHWAQGQWLGDRWQGKMTPVLIDHAAGFRKEADVRMTHENAFQTGRVKCVSARTYMRLRFLDLPLVQNLFSELLTEEEIQGLFKRRIQILKYLEDLAEAQGFEQTILDSCS